LKTEPIQNKSVIKQDNNTNENRKSVYLSAIKEQKVEEKKKTDISINSHPHKSLYLAAINEPSPKISTPSTEKNVVTDTNNINISSVKDYWLKQKIETKPPKETNPEGPKESKFKMDITKTPLAVASTSSSSTVHNVTVSSTGTYSYEALKKKPSNLFKDKLQEYLSDDEFKKVFNMSREEFNKLPIWAQAGRKKEVNLF